MMDGEVSAGFSPLTSIRGGEGAPFLPRGEKKGRREGAALSGVHYQERVWGGGERGKSDRIASNLVTPGRKKEEEGAERRLRWPTTMAFCIGGRGEKEKTRPAVTAVRSGSEAEKKKREKKE